MASNLRDIYVGVNKSDKNRNTNDLYRTPPLATYILHKYSTIPTNVVEPCAGYGNISHELMRCGYNVLSYDLNEYETSLVSIQTGQDVLELEKPQGFSALITNPPYHKNLPHKIAAKGLCEYDYVALLVRLTFLEGKKRKKIFDANPPSQLIFFSDRINFEGNSDDLYAKEHQIGGMIAYMWIVWDKNSKNSNTLLKWVSMEDEYDEWKSSI